jgi:hypothetical protein
MDTTIATEAVGGTERISGTRTLDEILAPTNLRSQIHQDRRPLPIPTLFGYLIHAEENPVDKMDLIGS